MQVALGYPRPQGINFGSISSDLWPYVLDPWLKKGVELSNDLSSGDELDQVAEERLAEIFNPHLGQNFKYIQRKTGDIESERTMFRDPFTSMKVLH